MRKILSGLTALLAMVALSAGFMASAHAQSADQLLADPQVDDIFVGRVDHFSRAEFGDKPQAAYGLMRIVNVTSANIVIVTEDAAWPESSGALGDLAGDFSDITWDMDEKITVKRADLTDKLKSGMIMDVRRLTAEEIKQYLN